MTRTPVCAEVPPTSSSAEMHQVPLLGVPRNTPVGVLEKCRPAAFAAGGVSANHRHRCGHDPRTP
jgi:hypothetical protein